MPPSHEGHSEQLARAKAIDQAIQEQGLYPREAFDFVRRGLSYTVQRIHSPPLEPGASRHVSGRQLCEGLRDLALAQWGMVARAVLNKWNIRRSEDFGKIVFTLVELGELSKTDEDNVEDFNGVFDFVKAFDGAYRIDGSTVRKALASSRS